MQQTRVILSLHTHPVVQDICPSTDFEMQ